MKLDDDAPEDAPVKIPVVEETPKVVEAPVEETKAEPAEEEVAEVEEEKVNGVEEAE